MFRLKKHRNSICILRLHLSPSVCLCLGFQDMVDTRVLTFLIIFSCQSKRYYFHYNLQGTFWGNIETRTRYLQKRTFELNSLAAKEWIANYNMSTSLTSEGVQQIMFLLRVSWDSARRFCVSIGGRHFKSFRIIAIVTLTCGHPKALIIEKTLEAQYNKNGGGVWVGVGVGVGWGWGWGVGGGGGGVGVGCGWGTKKLSLNWIWKVFPMLGSVLSFLLLSITENMSIKYAYQVV